MSMVLMQSDMIIMMIFSILSGLAEAQKAGVYLLTLEMNEMKFEIACDTGAQISFMSIKTFQKYFSKFDLVPCSTPFKSYGGAEINIVGKFSIKVKYQNMVREIVFLVTDTENPLLLFSFDLIQNVASKNICAIVPYSAVVDRLKVEHRTVFDGSLGAFNLSQVKLQKTSDAKPVFCKPIGQFP